tara:strand:- start:9953 stop:10270 length:318 start_codon:yes stop_codon:yes gene_type:complete
MNLPIKVTWPPMLYTDRSGQKWAVSGEHWVEVPDTLTLEQVGDYMVVSDREKPTQLAEVRTYDVVGSKGNTYTVVDNAGTWTCTCPGFGWRHKCRHIAEVKNASG